MLVSPRCWSRLRMPVSARCWSHQDAGLTEMLVSPRCWSRLRTPVSSRCWSRLRTPVSASAGVSPPNPGRGTSEASPPLPPPPWIVNSQSRPEPQTLPTPLRREKLILRVYKSTRDFIDTWHLWSWPISSQVNTPPRVRLTMRMFSGFFLLLGKKISLLTLMVGQCLV